MVRPYSPPVWPAPNAGFHQRRKAVAVSAAGRVVRLNAAAQNGFLVGAFSPEYTYGWVRQSAVQVIDGSCKTY